MVILFVGALLALAVVLGVALGCACLVGQMLAGCRQTGELSVETTSETTGCDWQLGRATSGSH